MDQKILEKLPGKFTEVILGAFRGEGKLWIESLPELVREIELNWSLEVKPAFPNLSYHYVAPCMLGDGGEAVVKIGFPGEAPNILNEAKMLKVLDGRGVVKMLRFDEKRFAFLLEKLTPGENLKMICAPDETRAVEIAINTMAEFWQKPSPNSNFPPLEKWYDDFERARKSNFAQAYIRKAARYFEELNSSFTPKMLLHGDFHHENILSAQRAAFLAIDPKGVVGSICYDIAVFLINHARWLKDATDLREQLEHAIRQFSEAFGTEDRTLQKWAFTQSVLSAWWTFEENSENWRRELAFTEIWEV